MFPISNGMRKRAKKYLVPHQGNNFRPHLLRAGGILIIFIFVFGAIFASSIQRIIIRTSDYIASILPSVLVDLANADRKAVSVNTLKINSKLEAAAQLKADDMAAKSYFAHYSPDGHSPWYWFRQADYDFVYAGENLAVNFDDSDAVNTAWMNSPGHKANIVNGKFTEIGIATAKGTYNGRATIFVVQMFGSPALPSALPQQQLPTVKETTVVKADATLIPISTSTVLGESQNENQIFISVKDASATPDLSNVASTPLGDRSYSSFVDKILSSPSKMLTILYSILTAFLMITLVAVVSVKHEHRAKHFVSVILLFILIFGILYYYKQYSGSSVELPIAQNT